MKKILVPVDFSDYSMNALEVATYIAKVKEMSIILLHVVEDSYVPYYSMAGGPVIETSTLYTYLNEVKEVAQRQLEDIAEKIRKEGISVEFEVLLDVARKAIVKYAEQKDADLIVIGSHGHSDIEDFFIGSTSEKVIRNASTPVLTVQEATDNYKIDKIVFASNFEDEAVEKVLKRVIRFAEIFMAELSLVRIETQSLFSGDEGRTRANELAGKFKLPAGAIVSYADRSTEAGIVNYAQEVGADLIALSTHGRTGFARLFRGSIAEEVSGSSKVPVLTYNISKERTLQSSRVISRERKIRSNSSQKEDL